MRTLSGLVTGTLFGVGLALGGMTQPAKVLAFLDVAGDWDPSLAFVMAGAIAVFAPAYRWIMRNAMPVYAQHFVTLTERRIDRRLVLGGAIFGIGWGLAGYCPGPGLVSAGSGALPGLVFAASMTLGMLLFHGYMRTAERRASRQAPTPTATPGQTAT